MNLKSILHNLPEIRSPVEKKLSFNVKLKWTIIILVAFFILSNIFIYGLAQNALEEFKTLAMILGTNFGSIISLGIGPIVMASIILQLLVGSKIINIDTTTEEGKKYFQGIQKLMVFFFVIFESIVYVLMKGLGAHPGFEWVVILQLILGGLAIVFMDEISSKWGFGSGVSLFIAAGVSEKLFKAAFQFLGKEGGRMVISWSGRIPVLINAIIKGNVNVATLAAASLIVTVLIFLVVVWAQSLKVEVPLSFDRLRGYGIKWPLSFFYASVIPVILSAALIANLQLVARLAENYLGHATFLGSFSGSAPISGIAFWLSSTNLVNMIITGSFELKFLLQGLTHILFFMGFSILFAVFWVKTSGMDASSQANNILKSGLQIPGFRKDERVLESILKRYILPLTIMGGAAIGLLAATADLLGALVSGTAILLAIMIFYQFYQNIAQQHAVDMHPALRKFI